MDDHDESPPTIPAGPDGLSECGKFYWDGIQWWPADAVNLNPRPEMLPEEE